MVVYVGSEINAGRRQPSALQTGTEKVFLYACFVFTSKRMSYHAIVLFLVHYAPAQSAQSVIQSAQI
jgi:hypothetical protein